MVGHWLWVIGTICLIYDLWLGYGQSIRDENLVSSMIYLGANALPLRITTVPTN
ncbi:hypothetical protein [Coleofasciculus sp. G2-EDA-02]|uniref:hypothetical protein n=1 Tax=Coleofasciculus sp. G2-EDA-02 TaxID=3069529 RepID=UPI0032F50085